MATREREGAILELLREKGECTVGDLCRALFVSEPTMRRDLARLASDGRILRTYGGAAPCRAPGENLPQALREREHSDAKAVIGRKCLSLIRDRDTVMVDGSSTALALLPLLSERKGIVLVTNNAKAPMLLADTAVKVLVSGGELGRGTYAFVGSYAEEFIRAFNADVSFFSVRTLTRDGRLTDNAMGENAVRRAMMASSQRSVLMLDSEKLGEPCLSTLCHLGDVAAVVSERDISGEFPAFREKFF